MLCLCQQFNATCRCRPLYQHHSQPVPCHLWEHILLRYTGLSCVLLNNILPCCQLHMNELLCLPQMTSLQCGVLSFAESACQSGGSCKVELTALPADCLPSTARLPSSCQACSGEHHGNSRHQLWLDCTHVLLCILTVCAGSCQWYRWSCQGTLCHSVSR